MDDHERFEELYRSIKRIEKNQLKTSSKLSVRNMSIHERSYNSGRYQTFERNKMGSSSRMSETMLLSSQRSYMHPCSLESEMKIESTTTEPCTTTYQGEGTLPADKESSWEAFEPNTVVTDEFLYQDDQESKSKCSSPQNAYETTDGYQSGESKMDEVQCLCEDCKRLYKNVRRRKPLAFIRDPIIAARKRLYDKCWIFVNRIPPRGSRKIRKRDLGSVVKRLSSMQKSSCAPAAGIRWRCCKTHIFLKRNFHLSEVEHRRLVIENECEKKRNPSKAGKKSNRGKQAKGTVPLKRVRDIYCFASDSSEEEGCESLRIKKFKLEEKFTQL